VHTEHDDSDIRIAFDNLRCRVDTIELRHGNVHHHDVWGELLGHPNRLSTIGRLANHFDIGIGLQQESEAFSHNAMIVGQEDFSGQGHMDTYRPVRVLAGGSRLVKAGKIGGARNLEFVFSVVCTGQVDFFQN
jgi:hypothetical protein